MHCISVLPKGISQVKLIEVKSNGSPSRFFRSEAQGREPTSPSDTGHQSRARSRSPISPVSGYLHNDREASQALAEPDGSGSLDHIGVDLEVPAEQVQPERIERGALDLDAEWASQEQLEQVVVNEPAPRIDAPLSSTFADGATRILEALDLGCHPNQETRANTIDRVVAKIAKEPPAEIEGKEPAVTLAAVARACSLEMSRQ